MSAAKRFLVIALAALLAACRAGVVHESVSPYSHIRVIDEGGLRTLLFVWDTGNTTVETVMNLAAPHELQHPYSHTMMAGLLYARRPESCLVVGLGGGALLRFINHDFPDLRLDVVEIDPAIVQVAREYFGTVPGPRTRIVVADAEQYLLGTSERYDIIFFDAHLKPGAQTDAIGVPSHLRAAEFLRRVRQRLSPDGAVVFNFVEGPDVRRGIDSLGEAFQSVQVFQSKGPGNTIAVAMASGSPPSENELRQRARRLDAAARRNFSFDSLLSERTSLR